jgi:hypothetical protein
MQYAIPPAWFGLVDLKMNLYSLCRFNPIIVICLSLQSHTHCNPVQGRTGGVPSNVIRISVMRAGFLCENVGIGNTCFHNTYWVCSAVVMLLSNSCSLSKHFRQTHLFYDERSDTT